MLARDGFVPEGNIVLNRAAYGVATFFELKRPAYIETIKDIEFTHSREPYDKVAVRSARMR
jgi:hypothetical protein